MTEPRFEVGGRVYIRGTVIEVYPGTGPDAQMPGPRERLEWSTPTEYMVDFGLPIGKVRVLEDLLGSGSN